MKTLSLAFFLVAIFATAFVSSQEFEEKDSTTPINEIPEQVEPRQTGEVEYDVEKSDAQDKEFDRSIVPSVRRPEAVPDKEQTQSVCSRSTILTSSSVTNLAEVNPYVKYFEDKDWIVSRYCCPRSQNYGCRSNPTRLPCSYSYVNGAWQWCCPLSTVFIHNCNCSKCAVMTSSCFYEGRCRRRYRKVTYRAICFRSNWWGYCTSITRYIPSSCYCQTIRPTLDPALSLTAGEN